MRALLLGLAFALAMGGCTLVTNVDRFTFDRDGGVDGGPRDDGPDLGPPDAGMADQGTPDGP